MNFQNLPARNAEQSDAIRRAIVPKRGAISSFDYEQIEPRLFAYYVAKGLGDNTVADWFRAGRDFYQEIAGLVYDKPTDQVTKDERQEGKVWYLMILYSAGPKKIAAETGMSLKDARDFYHQFHHSLPWIKLLSNPPPSGSRGWDGYQPGLIERVIKSRGYIKTPWGRHLHVPKYGEHKMLNSLIQGSAADLMKQAITRSAAWQRDPGMSGLVVESRMTLTVHDELQFDGPMGEIDLLHMVVPKLMIDDAIQEVVPLGVDHEIALTNLAEMIGYEEWLATQEVTA